MTLWKSPSDRQVQPPPEAASTPGPLPPPEAASTPASSPPSPSPTPTPTPEPKPFLRFSPTPEKKQPRKAPLITLSVQSGAFWNLCSALSSSGILGMSYALNQGGFLPGLLLMLLLAFLTVISVRFLIQLATQLDLPTLDCIGHRAFGPVGYYSVCFFQFTLSLGTMVAYIIVVADTLPIVFGRWLGVPFDSHGNPMHVAHATWIVRFLTNRIQLTTLLSYVMMLPMCLSGRIDALAKYSFLSIVGVFFICVCIMLRYAEDPSKYHSTAALSRGAQYDYIEAHAHLLPAFGTIAFSFVCQHQVFLVYDTLPERNPKQFNRLFQGAVITTTLLSMIFGIFGYLTFVETTKGNILLNYTDMRDHLLDVCRVIAALVSLLAYPLELTVVRHTCSTLLSGVSLQLKENDPGTCGREEKVPLQASSPSILLLPSSKKDASGVISRDACRDASSEGFGDYVRVFLTVALLTISLLFGLFAAHDLGDTLTFTGGFSASFIGYILPAAFHLRLTEKRSSLGSAALAIFILVLGVVGFLGSTSGILHRFFFQR